MGDTSLSDVNIALAAGEASGDQLGAALAQALRQHQPDIRLAGITGPAMQAADVRSLATIDQLNVMGLTEVLAHLPRLIRFRRTIRQKMINSGAPVFVGIDAPDFNLGLARQLRRRGIKTAQWVAPSVWAWRRYRIKKIVRSVDLLMTLFPFEPQHFADTDLDVRYIGHPLADALPLQPDREQARSKLGLDANQPVVALLPGSRDGEIQRHARLIIETAQRLRRTDPTLQTILLLAEKQHAGRFRQAAGVDPAEVGLSSFYGQTRDGLSAADVAVAASGTVTLEALLCKTPMTVFYRLAPGSYWLAQRLVKTRWIALPNVLADDALVPERIQADATAEQLANDAMRWLDSSDQSERFQQCALHIHQRLACSAAERAATALLEKFNPGRSTAV